MAREREQKGLFFDISSVCEIIAKNQLPLSQSSNPSHYKSCRLCNEALMKEHEEHGFCSQPCAAKIWEMFRQALPSNFCKMPGCSKPCYMENTKVYDFCGRSHAYSYKAMTEEFERERMRKRLMMHFDQSLGSCERSSHTRSGATYGVKKDDDYGSGVIRFYKKDEPYYQFTNFYPAPITLDDKQWPTTEHYFQAQKFIGTPFTEEIRRFQHPREAFDYSRNRAVSCWRRKDWEVVKLDIMRKALLAKFTQHEYLRKMLLRTGDNMLIEHSPYDSFWGNGGDGSGHNHLGMLLMEIRHDLKRNQNIGNDSTAVKAAFSIPGNTTFSGSSKNINPKSSHLEAVTWDNNGEKNNSGMLAVERKTLERRNLQTKLTCTEATVQNVPSQRTPVTRVDNMDRTLVSNSMDSSNQEIAQSCNQGRRQRIGVYTDYTRPPLRNNPQPMEESGKSLVAKHVPVANDLVDLTDPVTPTKLQTPIQETQGPPALSCDLQPQAFHRCTVGREQFISGRTRDIDVYSYKDCHN